MPSLSSPLRFVLVARAGWMNQQQREVIDYLQRRTARCGNPVGFTHLITPPGHTPEPDR